jgi:macrolide transport system ATP-binding/permease protein
MSIFSRIANLFRRTEVDREIEREMNAHIAMRMEDNRAAGMPAGQARRDALLRFGNRAATRERTGGMDKVVAIESIGADLHYAWRQLMRNPGFAVSAVGVLALGIGACVAIFAFVDAVLIKPLPYRDPARLVGLFETTTLGPRYHLSHLDYLDWKNMNTSFSELEAFDGFELPLKTSNGVEPVQGAVISAGFLRMMGIAPVLGRDFQMSEETRAVAPVALLSYAAWQRRYGGQASALGQTVVLDNVAYQIVGVLPRDFNFAAVGDAELWLPLRPGAQEDRGDHGLSAIARLKSGVDLRTAQAEMSGIAARLASQYPDADGGRGATVELWTELVVGNLRPVLLLLMVGSLLLLGMACVNVASLLLVRSEKRRREIAVRGALGASRSRLVRQFMTEGLMLASLGTALGLALACGAMRLLGLLVPGSVLAGMPYLRELGLNWHVAIYAAAVAILIAAIFALTPLVRLGGSAGALRDGLAADGRTAAGTVWRHLGANLVVLELAAAMVLLTGAGLLAKSLYRLLHTDLGLDASHLAMVHVRLPNTPEFAKDAGIAAFARQAIVETQRLPGVESVAASHHLPVNNSVGGNTTFLIVGRPAPGSNASNEASQRAVSDGFFSTLKTRLIRGRFFTATDDATHPLVAIVNQAFARRYFPGEDVVGKQLQFDSSLPPVSIVGVTEDMREAALDQEVPPAIYQPIEQAPDTGFFVIARTTLAPEGTVKTLEQMLRGMAPGMMIYSAETMEDRIHNTQSASLHRASAALVGGFAVLALILSAVGLYGVIAYSVSQRTREIGVRMALGAERGAVSRMVLHEAGRLAVAGIAVGLACAVGAAMLMRGLLFGTAPWDATTLAAVAAVLGACTLLASYIPARRAASVNPVEALRAE